MNYEKSLVIQQIFESPRCAVVPVLGSKDAAVNKTEFLHSGAYVRIGTGNKQAHGLEDEYNKVW